MKTAIKTIFAIAILFIVSFGLSLYQNNSVLEQHPNITKSETAQSEGSVSDSRKTAGKLKLDSKVSASKNTKNNHKSNDKSHSKEFLFLGLKAGDWIALIGVAVAIWASLKGLKQNRISNEKQNRAYVFLKSCKLSQTFDENKVPIGFEIVIDLTNGGATPANHLKIETWLTTPKDYDSPVSKGGSSPDELNPIYIAPGDSKGVRLGVYGIDYTPQLHKDLSEGKRCVKLLGEAKFQDQFGNEQRFSFRCKTILRDHQKLVGSMVVADEGLVST